MAEASAVGAEQTLMMNKDQEQGLIVPRMNIAVACFQAEPMHDREIGSPRRPFRLPRHSARG